MRRWVRNAALSVLCFTWSGCDLSHEHDDSREHGDSHGQSDSEHREHGDHEEDPPGGHGHAEDAIGITRFTDKLELFAEHAPAVTGKELTFLAHLTILDGFRALETATVTLMLSGPAQIEARVTEKLRPGIFQPTLTAPAPGTYRAKLVVTGPQVEDTIAGFEIVVHADEASAKSNADDEESDGPATISFLKEQQWQVPFGTAFAKQASLVPTIEVPGEITTPPGGRAEVSAAIAGRIVAPREGLPVPGTKVTKGTLLATIAPAPAAPEMAARADLAVVEAEARVQAAQSALARAERLFADRAISEREVEDARREKSVAEQAVDAARRARSVFTGAASGRGAGTFRVTSPIDGIVVDVAATEGKAVSSGDLILRVVNLSELWVQARVPEQRAALVRADQDAAFQLPGLETWWPLKVTGEATNAKVVNVGRTVDPRSRTIDVIYGLSEADERLRVGAMVRVAVPAGELWQGVVVPRDAVLEDAGRSIMYVQVEGEAFEERVVRLGPSAGALVGIETGIRAEERIVTRGGNVVRLASRSATAPAHGHVH